MGRFCWGDDPVFVLWGGFGIEGTPVCDGGGGVGASSRYVNRSTGEDMTGATYGVGEMNGYAD